MFPRFNVLGVGVHAVNLRQVLTSLMNAATEKRRGYVCMGNARIILAARKDETLRDILNSSLLTIPDGPATVHVGHAFGCHCLASFAPQELISQVCRRSAVHGFRHFLYGTGDLSHVHAELVKRCPELQIVGTAIHPGRPLTLKEETDLIRQVRDAEPDFFWVGLESPEQEKFMASYLPKLHTRLMIGVGSSINGPAIASAAPAWRRYLVDYPKFAALLTAQMFGLLRCDVPRRNVAGPATYHLPRAA